ncbi:DNA polymerase III subunit beta [Desulfovibrio sp. OttesenSCG-928-C14]|nr:DNA polymerase III subunit beta [Desulfovibrio sp. OttesenSCG-928-C14]
MYIKVYKEDIIEGLQKAASIIPSKSGAAYLRSIWIKTGEGKVEILATDSSIEFKGAYTSEIVNEGLVGVQGRTFVDLMRQLPADQQITLRLEEESNNLLIEQGKRKYKLPANDAVWFQTFSEFPESAEPGSVIWAGDYIKEVIDRVSYCISDDDAMDAIACLSLKPTSDGGIEACGLNGHQFAMVKFMHDDLHAMLPADGILIQKKYLNELKKWLDDNEIELGMGDKRLFFRSSAKNETFSLPLSSYQFPEYYNFLSKLDGEDVAKLNIDRAECAGALERLSLFTSDGHRCIFFDFSSASSGEVVLYSTGQGTGSATEILNGEFNGSLDKISFPSRNLIEMLAHFQSGKLRLIMSGSEAPCGILGDDDPEYTVIIMPMKIVSNTYYSEESVE